MTKTKFEAMELLNEHDIPCGPILSMKELAAEPSLRETGTVVEVDHPKRGKYLTVGNPDQAERQPDRGQALAAARRAHRRGAGGARLQRAGDRRLAGEESDLSAASMQADRSGTRRCSSRATDGTRQERRPQDSRPGQEPRAARR